MISIVKQRILGKGYFLGSCTSWLSSGAEDAGEPWLTSRSRHLSSLQPHPEAERAMKRDGGVPRDAHAARNKNTKKEKQRVREDEESRAKDEERKKKRKKRLPVTKVGLCQPLTSFGARLLRRRTRFHEPAMQDPSKDADTDCRKKDSQKRRTVEVERRVRERAAERTRLLCSELASAGPTSSSHRKRETNG